jgi:hypothetical protein
MDFNSALALPSPLPHVDDYVGRKNLEQLTHGRILQGLDMDEVEHRARRLLSRLKCKQLKGSQPKFCAHYPYYTEMVAHELAHARLLDIPWSTRRLDSVIYNQMRPMDKELSNTNEYQSAAITMLVLEYLGFPYDVHGLALSTAQNIRGESLALARAIYPRICKWRDDPKMQEVARQIAFHLLKMKYVEAEKAS